MADCLSSVLRNRVNLVLCVALCAGVAALPTTSSASGLSAQSTDFSGRWRVNPAAGFPPSQSSNEEIWLVTQTSTEFEVRTTINGREVSVYSWRFGAPPTVMRRDNMDSMTTVALGSGELVIAGEGTFPTGVKGEVREQWVIDPATKALRVLKVTTMAGGTMSRQLVLERVAAP